MRNPSPPQAVPSTRSRERALLVIWALRSGGRSQAARLTAVPNSLLILTCRKRRDQVRELAENRSMHDRCLLTCTVSQREARDRFNV